jgi:hypothetical protein
MYKEMAEIYLRDKKPELENREQVAAQVAKDAKEREAEIFKEMAETEEDIGRRGMLKLISRELATDEATDFLSNL